MGLQRVGHDWVTFTFTFHLCFWKTVLLSKFKDDSHSLSTLWSYVLFHCFLVFLVEETNVIFIYAFFVGDSKISLCSFLRYNADFFLLFLLSLKNISSWVRKKKCRPCRLAKGMATALGAHIMQKESWIQHPPGTRVDRLTQVCPKNLTC